MKENNPLSRPAKDLLWCVRSPPLVTAGKSDAVYPTAAWFAGQHIPDSLTPEPPPTRFRLGIHFEKIFQLWLTHHPDYSLRAANLQVQLTGARHSKRTLGEFDLLVDVAEQLEHWELAVKFYINVSEPGDANRWFGPDPNDTLGSKMSRMQSHQLALGQHPAAKQLLTDMGLNLPLVARAIVKGRLYHPFDSYRAESGNLPEIVNPDHLRGWWLASDQLPQLAGHKVAYIDKQYWLSPITADDQLETLDEMALNKFIQETRQIAPQFALLDDQRCEISRGFILKPEWFAQAS